MSATCPLCGNEVQPGQGETFQMGERTASYHLECPPSIWTNTARATCWMCGATVEPGQGWLSWYEGHKDEDGERRHSGYMVRRKTHETMEVTR